jgi:cell division transport system permease protein
MRFWKKTFQDFRDNPLLSIVTLLTIATSILIVSAMLLFFTNVGNLLTYWRSGIKIMIYLENSSDDAMRLAVKYRVQKLPGVVDARFIPKDEGFNWLLEQMRGTPSLLADLKDNPLPDAFEIHLTADHRSLIDIERLAAQLERMEGVADVEYGQQWLGRFSQVMELFRLAGYVLGTLFTLAATFIVANTIRLVLYARREEIEIMRLVGAEDWFIKTPFYIQGVLQGLAGGGIGMLALWGLYRFVTANLAPGVAAGIGSVAFLPLSIVAAILFGSTVIGWLGCYLSLKQFLTD